MTTWIFNYGRALPLISSLCASATWLLTRHRSSDRWSESSYRAALADPDQAYLLIVESPDPVGFVPLAGLANEHRGIELRRIVVATKGQGVGRRALTLMLRHALTTLRAHRVWLDVKVHNERARRAYNAVGFKEEGALRDALLTDGEFESLAIMSILETEWTTNTAQ